MINMSILPASLAAAMLLSGCAGTKNRGLESVHQPVVARSSYTLDVVTSAGALNGGERRRLDDWMRALRLGYGDRVAIDDPAGASSVAAAQIADTVARYGLLVDRDAPVTVGAPAPGTVRVVVNRLNASVPGCPDWSLDSSHDLDQNTSSNYGCAINRNLAAMVANPADLVRGQQRSELNDPATAFRAIDTFRKALPTGGGGTVVKAETTSKGSN